MLIKFTLGIKTMQKAIFLRKHIHIDINVVARALKEIPSYLYHLVPRRKNQLVGHQETFTIGENVHGLKL
jgi:hypothetical protein